jgi:hypothetical protein
VIHLTQRALEFLRENMMPPKGYVSEIGQPACDSMEGLTVWCKTEDVRAMARGQKTTFEWNGNNAPRKERPVRLPTCPKCQVILDKALAACPEDYETPLVSALTAIMSLNHFFVLDWWPADILEEIFVDVLERA